MADHKNDYAVIAFFNSSNQTKKWGYVHSLYKFSKFLNSTHSDWKYFNVYDRRTGKYLKRFYSGNNIPAFI